MPYKNPKCGIYIITTPNDSSYIGSSINILNRWSEHRMHLRKKTHHSVRLQMAFNKHKNKLSFSILCECKTSELNELEQKYINLLKPVLNTAQFVNNVWANPETRAKIEKTYSTQEFKNKRSLLAKTSTWCIATDCSDGNSFISMAEAAQFYNVTTSTIKNLIKTRRYGKCGLKFKKSSNEWKEPISISEQICLTRARNETNKLTDKQRKNISMGKKGKPLSAHIHQAALKANIKPVIGTKIKTGEKVYFCSQRQASRWININKYKTVGSQISKVINGVNKSAYGYYWENCS